MHLYTQIITRLTVELEHIHSFKPSSVSHHHLHIF